MEPSLETGAIAEVGSGNYRGMDMLPSWSQKGEVLGRFEVLIDVADNFVITFDFQVANA
jgi:hypothetical protein